MRDRFVRPFLVFVFLMAIEAWLTFWSQVGGQYHLDLMFWPWKFGLTLAAAALTAGIALELFRSAPARWSRRILIYAALLLLVMATAGAVTYYYHVNEPDEDDNGDTPTTRSTELRRPARSYQTRQALAETIGLPTVQPNAF